MLEGRSQIQDANTQFQAPWIFLLALIINVIILNVGFVVQSKLLIFGDLNIHKSQI